MAGVDVVSVAVALRGTSTPVLSSSSWSDVLDFVPGLFEQDAEKQAQVAAAIRDKSEDVLRGHLDFQHLTVEVVAWVKSNRRACFFLEHGKLWVLFPATGHTLRPQLERLREFADGVIHGEACLMFDFVVSQKLLTHEEVFEKCKLGIKARVDAFKPSRKRMIQFLYGAHFRKLHQTKKQAAEVAAAAAVGVRLARAGVKEQVQASDRRRHLQKKKQSSKVAENNFKGQAAAAIAEVLQTLLLHTEMIASAHHTSCSSSSSSSSCRSSGIGVSE
jgi:hypothetical protein